MQSAATSVEAYLAEAPAERQAALRQLRTLLRDRLTPLGFEEAMSYGMVGYVVPHSRYPAGYHCDPKLPLPFLSFASQKQSINLYHMGLYAQPELMAWFQAEHAKASAQKLDMGQSCVRYKKPEHIPFDLIDRLARRLSADDWIALYETLVRPQKK
jgi:hypothetical protein